MKVAKHRYSDEVTGNAAFPVATINSCRHPRSRRFCRSLVHLAYDIETIANCQSLMKEEARRLYERLKTIWFMPDRDKDPLKYCNWEVEEGWRNLYYLLIENGYELRDLYHPRRSNFFDPPGDDMGNFGTRGPRGNVMDARCITTGELVILKKIRADTLEVEAMMFLSHPEAVNLPENHCVPLLDLIWLYNDETAYEVILVLPYLYPLHEPPVDERSQLLDILFQLLEGLNFMHMNDFVHGDIAYVNIMMFAQELYEEEHHPCAPHLVPDGSRLCKTLSRTGRFVKYVYIDFGMSIPFSLHSGRHPLVWSGGRERSAPELSEALPCDLFMLDVYCLGVFFRKRIVEGHNGMEAFNPLVAWMCEDDPTKRPTAVQALQKYLEIASNLPPDFSDAPLEPNIASFFS